MKHDTWIKATTGNASIRAIARTIDIPQRTLAAQVEGDRITPENVIAIAIAYGTSPVDALVDTGYLPAEFAAPVTLRGASEDDLADEVLRRMSCPGDHSRLHAPVDELITEEPDHDRSFAARRHA